MPSSQPPLNHGPHDHASPIPPYLRPATSRHPSSSSIRSNRSHRSHASQSNPHPHPQQTQFIPSTLDGAMQGEASPSDIAERVLYDEIEDDDARKHGHGHGQSSRPPPAYRDDPDAGDGGYESGDDEDDHDSEADWNAAREGSNSRRPAWRRANPKWIYPFVVGVTLALGNAMAPRSELYINLACLAHPPEAPASLDLSMVHPSGVNSWSVDFASGPTSGYINDTRQVSEPRSPADEWFLRLQREIYEYKKSHHMLPEPTPDPGHSTSERHHTGSSTQAGSSTRVPGNPTPTGPIPRPDYPADGSYPDQEPGGSGNGKGNGGKDKPSTNGPPFREIDPALCKKSPKVQAAAAKLTMAMTVTGGILAALTTGHWGRLSDRLGRTRILFLAELGLTLNEIAFIAVATFPYLVPGGYRALLLGPTCEGLVGGMSTLMATVNAYISDTTPDGSRATVFARMGGIAMTGFALGPILGSWVISATGNIMIPFYISAAVHAFYMLFILFILPESLSTEARTILTANAKAKRLAQKRKEAADREWEDQDAEPIDEDNLGAGAAAGPSSAWSRLSGVSTGTGIGAAGHSKRRKRWTGNMRRLGWKLTAPVQPLEVFLPRQRLDEDGMELIGRDWNMTFIGCAMFMMSLLLAFIQMKAQYTFYAFGWTSAQLGPYLSVVSFSRGFTMIVLIPLGMKFAKPYFLSKPTPSEPSQSTASETDRLLPAGSSNAAESNPDSPVETVKSKPKRPAVLDLYLARLSLLLETSLMFIISTGLSPIQFILASTALTLASGHSPAANSLALTLGANSRESGRLFGGIAVLQALGTSLIGPLAFGSLFSATVGTYTEAIFALAGAVQLVAFTLFMFVRLPKERPLGDDGERGRSKKVKATKSLKSLKQQQAGGSWEGGAPTQGSRREA